MDNHKFWTWNNFRHEAIFALGIFAAYAILLTVETTEYVALVSTLVVIVVMSSYFSVVFFKSPSAHQLYFYFISLFFLIGYFALIYKSFGVIPPTANVSSQVGWLDAIYFSVVTWTTLGYGDFRPGDEVKLWVIAEALIGYIYMGLLVGKLLIIGQKRIE